MQTELERAYEEHYEGLRAIHKAIKDLHVFANKYSKKQTILSSGNLAYCEEQLKELRIAARQMQLKDPLVSRALYCGGVWRCTRFHISTPLTDRVKFYLKNEYWVDDFIRCLRSNDWNSIHNKQRYIRDGNDFYDKDDYFQHKDGKIYNKSEYDVNSAGELIDLSKSLPIEANCYCYRAKEEFKFKDWLTPEDGSVMESNEVINDNWLVAIRPYVYGKGLGFYSGQLFNRNFWYTMFKFGMKRFFGNANYEHRVLLDSNMLKTFEFNPTKDHYRIWINCKLGLNKYFMQHPNAKEYSPDLSSKGDDLAFDLDINPEVFKTAGIKDKIFKSVAGPGVCSRLSLDALLDKLNLLRDVLKAEEPYVKASSN